jgi:serine-type D-Ala-D-Ala carboxypeptidase/endopeptidase (penicillin-binding protein 4)
VPFTRFATTVVLSLVSVAFGDLQSTVQSIARRADLNKGTVGICIIDTQTGEKIVQINAKDVMIPASNQKLLTSGAALHVLGSNFAFQTRLVQNGDDIILLGDGDPTIGDAELHGLTKWNNENRLLDDELAPWISAIKSSGIQKIKTLYVDDRIFDRSFVHPSWPSDQINNWYCAQVSGLNYHLNVVHFMPSPNGGGQASLGDIAPRMDWITFGNKTSSKTGKKNTSSFWIARSPNSNKMTARGNVNATHTSPVKVAFHDPALVFGETLASLLRKNGVSVNKVAIVAEEALPTTGKILFTHTTPLQSALQRSNTDSHNLYAEALLKRVSAQATGRSGTFDEGANVIQAVVQQRLGDSSKSVVVADGSGMSRDNQISPYTLARWLASFNVREPAGKALLQSLAVPGKGTLDSRFKTVELGEAQVHAKSGYLRGVCSLSGYVTFPDRAPLAFSIIVNDVKGTVRGAKKMQERIIEAAIKFVSEPI